MVELAGAEPALQIFGPGRKLDFHRETDLRHLLGQGLGDPRRLRQVGARAPDDQQGEPFRHRLPGLREQLPRLVQVEDDPVERPPEYRRQQAFGGVVADRERIRVQLPGDGLAVDGGGDGQANLGKKLYPLWELER